MLIERPKFSIDLFKDYETHPNGEEMSLLYSQIHELPPFLQPCAICGAMINAKGFLIYVEIPHLGSDLFYGFFVPLNGH